MSRHDPQPGSLEPLAQDLWTVTHPLSLFGLHLGSQMTVIRLGGGEILLHSPVPVTEALAAEIDALGPVRWVLAPAAFHHLAVRETLARWPDAAPLCSATLLRKRPDVAWRGVLEAGRGPFGDELAPIHIDGSLLDETVLWHRATSTLVSVDLIENFQRCDHLPTRLYLKANGIWRRPGWGRALRLLYRDHRAARASIDAVRTLHPERCVVAHGDNLEGDIDAILAEAFTWLRS